MQKCHELFSATFFSLEFEFSVIAELVEYCCASYGGLSGLRLQYLGGLAVVSQTELK